MKNLFIDTGYNEGIIIPAECFPFLRDIKTVKLGYDDKYTITDIPLKLQLLDESLVAVQSKKEEEPEL